MNYTPYTQPEPKIQQLLREAGYQAGSVGKLHFHPPTVEHARETGFDRVLLDDGVRRTDPYSDYVRWRRKNDPNAEVHYQKTISDPQPGENPFRAVIDKEYTPTAWTGRESRRILRDFASSSRPVFLFSSYFKPHSPHTIPEPFDSLYNEVDIPLPRRVGLEYIQRLPLPVQKMILRGTPRYDTDRELLQWMYRSYYGSVTWLDQEIGATLDELERCGKLEDTIVIIASDHGDQLLEHGLIDKNVFFEASVRIPLVVSWPEHIRPGVYSDLTETVDVLPSILELFGLSVPDHIQGRSFAPLVAGNRSLYKPREALFAENIIPEVTAVRLASVQWPATCCDSDAYAHFLLAAI